MNITTDSKLIANFAARVPSGFLLSWEDGTRTAYRLDGNAGRRRLTARNRNGIEAVWFEDARDEAAEVAAQAEQSAMLDAAGL